jgi:predicted nucleic acid-binding protein
MAIVLLDTNVLLRLSDGAAAEQFVAEHAVSRLRLRGDHPYITAQNIIEFWAVATRPLDANGLGWSTQQAATEITQLLDTFPLLVDGSDILTHWLTLVTVHDIKGKKVHDARLVAVMQTHGVTHLLTFNTDDFTGYPHITLLHPKDIV